VDGTTRLNVAPEIKSEGVFGSPVDEIVTNTRNTRWSEDIPV